MSKSYGPLGTPLYWRNDQSDELSRSIEAYMQNRTDGTPINREQIMLLREYLEYYVNAPCWEVGGEIDDELRDLRRIITMCTSAFRIDTWIHRALEIGMDPL